MRIVIAEDQEMGRLILAGHLRRWGHDVIETAHGDEAFHAIINAKEGVDMLITDWNMPVMDGLELARRVRDYSTGHHYIYIILLTGRGEFNDRLEGFSEGGVDDYMVKPFDGSELHMRIQVGNRVINAERMQREVNIHLQSMVREQTALIRKTQEEIVNRLSTALRFRDGDMGGYVYRIGPLSAAMGKLLGWDASRIDTIKCAAPLLDIGEIATPDALLRKGDSLTNEEFDAIKKHVEVGASMLSGSHNAVIQMAETIARCHHEKWDGSGYPRRLCGEQIPIEARVVAIADVYDTLLSSRAYRPGFPEDKVLEMMKAEVGERFDPHLFNIFVENLEQIKEYVNAHLPRGGKSQRLS